MAQIDRKRVALIRNAWLRWLMIFVPGMVVIALAMIWLDQSAIMTVLLTILAAGLLYQRFVNKRTWRSIMWGVHVKDD